MKASPRNVRRKFDETFKREAVNSWLSSGKSAAIVAKELGIAEGRLYAWRTQLLPPAAAGGGAAAGGRRPSAADLQSQVDLLLRELQHVREQRDILKKTLGILSEPPRSASPASTR